VVEAGVGRFRSFWFTTSEEIHVLARLEPVMVTSMDVMTLLEASSRSLCVRLPPFLIRRETSDPRNRAMEALVCVFLLLGGIVSESTCLGTGEGGLVAEVAGEGRCGQFGIDDAASGVWVAARAWLVGLRRVR
jgi:hypothetical protein